MCMHTYNYTYIHTYIHTYSVCMSVFTFIHVNIRHTYICIHIYMRTTGGAGGVASAAVPDEGGVLGFPGLPAGEHRQAAADHG